MPTPASTLRIPQVMRALARANNGHPLPAVEKIAASGRRHAFHVLISTLLSARTQDATTHAAAERLFRAAATPPAMAALTRRRLEELIYPVSFYRNKARHVKAASRLLVERFGGRVPATMDELLRLPGVGRKTANLVLILAFGSRDNICVDTHVHRISNRLGWVKTRTPEETEQALYRVADRRWWADINLHLVTWGQNVCRPIRPRCAACVISRWCRRVGVDQSGLTNVGSPSASSAGTSRGGQAHSRRRDGGDTWRGLPSPRHVRPNPRRTVRGTPVLRES